VPIHDWTKTYAGAFHHFHGTWLFEIARVLNEGILPKGYYALGEQVIGGAVPDVLTLEKRGAESTSAHFQGIDAPLPAPTATITALAEAPRYPPRPRVIAIRHASGDRLIALLEIVSIGNKDDAADLGSLVEKTVVALSKGIHALLLDLHPPGSMDPKGIHNLIWTELGQDPTPLPLDKPLLIASYLAEKSVKCFIEPRAVGDELPDMPLFLTSTRYVRVPLERTYRTAFASLPAHLREMLS
jgi:hypothetical protein